MARSAGFTLWELLCALLIAAIVLSAGAPSLHALVLDARRTADVNAFVLAVQLARSEATKRARAVVLCKTADGLHCGGDELRFDAGFMVFVNEDDLRPPDRAPTEPLLSRYVPTLVGTITANRRLFEFRPFRQRSTNATVVFCDERGAAAARAVIVSYTGRPRVDSVAPDGSALTCAALP